MRGCGKRWYGALGVALSSAAFGIWTSGANHKCRLGKYHFGECACECGMKGDVR